MGNDIEKPKVRVLIACKNEGKGNAYEFSEIYKHKFEVEYNTEIANYDLAVEYAKNNEMTHMLYFIDDINLVLASFADEMGGYAVDVTVDDLKNVLS